MAVRDDLLRGLNEDPAGEPGTIIRYDYQAGRRVIASRRRP